MCRFDGVLVRPCIQAVARFTADSNPVKADKTEECFFTVRETSTGSGVLREVLERYLGVSPVRNGDYLRTEVSERTTIPVSELLFDLKSRFCKEN